MDMSIRVQRNRIKFLYAKIASDSEIEYFWKLRNKVQNIFKNNLTPYHWSVEIVLH